MAFKVYDADQIVINWAGIPIDSGFADGEFCRVEQNENDFTTYVGTDGDVSRSKTNNRTAVITILLAQTSPTNAALSAVNNLDRIKANGAGVGPLLIKDKNGTSLYAAEKCWISKPPAVSFDRTTTTREWTLECASLERLDGGN